MVRGRLEGRVTRAEVGVRVCSDGQVSHWADNVRVQVEGQELVIQDVKFSSRGSPSFHHGGIGFFMCN